MSSAFSAVRWVLFGSFGFRFISIAGQMLILRLVDKDVFGVYRAIVLIHLIAIAVLPFGFDTLVVREKKRMSRYVVAATLMLMIMGSLFAAGTFLLSLLPGIGDSSILGQLMEIGEDYPALFLMPPIFAVQAAKLSIRSVHNAKIDFRTISLGEFGNGLITWLGGAAIVLLFKEAWALLAVYLIGEIFECAWFYRRQPFRPLAIAEQRNWPILRKLFRKHRAYCFYNTSDLTLNNVGSLLPGVLFAALISKAATAEFSVALQLLVLPVMLLAGALWRVAFPSLSGVPEEDLQSRCLKIISGSAAFIAPAVIWFAFFAPTTTWILAGEQYIDTVPPLVRWMAIYMVLGCIFSPISSIDMIRDRPEVGLYWNIAHTLGRIAIIYYFEADGLLAALAAMAVFSMGMWIIWIYMIGWLVGAPWRDYVGSVARFIPGWAMLAVGFAAANMLTDEHLIWAPALSIVPGLAYLVLIRYFYPDAAHLLRRLSGV